MVELFLVAVLSVWVLDVVADAVRRAWWRRR